MLSDEGQTLSFVYYVLAIGGGYALIFSEEIHISTTFDSVPEKLEYI